MRTSPATGVTRTVERGFRLLTEPPAAVLVVAELLRAVGRRHRTLRVPSSARLVGRAGLGAVPVARDVRRGHRAAAAGSTCG